jgi:hypothetical protein
MERLYSEANGEVFGREQGLTFSLRIISLQKEKGHPLKESKP